MDVARCSFPFGFKALFCAALITGVATASSAYNPDSDAKAAYDRAAVFRAAFDYRSARVELMNATAQDSRWGAAFVAQAEVALELFDAVAARAALDKATSLGVPESETTHQIGRAHV